MPSARPALAVAPERRRSVWTRLRDRLARHPAPASPAAPPAPVNPYANHVAERDAYEARVAAEQSAVVDPLLRDRDLALGLATHKSPHAQRIRYLIAQLPQDLPERYQALEVARIEVAYWAAGPGAKDRVVAPAALERARREVHAHEVLIQPTTMLIPGSDEFRADGTPKTDDCQRRRPRGCRCWIARPGDSFN